MNLMKQMLFLAAAGTLAIGCGSDDNTCDDAGCPDGAVINTGDASSSDAILLWGLSRGTNMFTVTSIANVTDGCMTMPSALVGLQRPVTYDETTMMVSVGTPLGSPPTPSLGVGKVGANMATLVRDNLSGEATAECYWHAKNTSKLTLVNHDKFTLDVVEEQDTFAAKCMPIPAGGKCMGSYQFTFEKK